MKIRNEQKSLVELEQPAKVRRNRTINAGNVLQATM
jgi:hypothetical protein